MTIPTSLRVKHAVRRSLTPRRSWLLDHPRQSSCSRDARDLSSAGPRLWKCQSYGNHKTISTGLWKSRTEREIPTFPQPILIAFEKKKDQEARTLHVPPGRSARHGLTQ
jgi:hypothetical protein